MNEFLKLTYQNSADILPAFFFALLISAILDELLPENLFAKLPKSASFISVFFSSIIGALIPLCTCGMIPLASKLRKKGVSWLIIISFLTAGNASSITAILLTLVLGIKITLLRFLFAVFFGVSVAYIFCKLFTPNEEKTDLFDTNKKICFNIKRIFADFIQLICGFGPWVLAAIIIATAISLYLKPNDVLSFAGANNIFSPFLLTASGFPFYFCAGTDIPISKALLEKGASIGSVLAFMTASPGVNLTSLIVYQKWIGFKNTIIYLCISLLVCGITGLFINMFLN